MIEQLATNFNVDLSYKVTLMEKACPRKITTAQLPIYKGQKLSNFIIYK